MPENLTQITKDWQTFYYTLAGATATLMGLLFVSLALHSKQIHEEENSHFLRLARLTFSNYLMLLILAFQMLVPIHAKMQLLLPIIVTAIIGLIWTIKLRNRKVDEADPNKGFLVRSYWMTLLSYIFLFGCGLVIQAQVELALYLLLSPVMMLMIGSVRNSWGLLMMLRAKE